MQLLQSLFYELTARFPSRLNRSWMAHYPFQFTPSQLCFLIRCLERTKDLAGPIVEVGVSRGATTIFLNKYLDELATDKRYVAIDTFSGFTEKDIAYEVETRRKRRDFTWRGYSNNKQEWFDKTMQLSGISRVQTVRADANTYDFDNEANISFCLLDVDLYLPMKASLMRIIPRMGNGGILVIDDCYQQENIFDGAAQAHREVCETMNLPHAIVHDKLGFLQFSKRQHASAEISPLEIESFAH